jgi:hypothetical protein
MHGVPPQVRPARGGKTLNRFRETVSGRLHPTADLRSPWSGRQVIIGLPGRVVRRPTRIYALLAYLPLLFAVA